MTNFNEIINDDTPVLVDFYADWCAPCKMMPPILKQLKDSLGDKIRIIKIDSEKNAPLSQKYQVRSIPTLILFKKGLPAWQHSGVLQAGELIDAMKYQLGIPNP